MDCVPICLIAFALVGMFLGSHVVKMRSKIFRDFNASMTAYQKQVYRSIVAERGHIFLNSLLLGIFIALLTSYWFYKNKKMRTPIKELGCYFTAVVLFVTYIGYMIHPKSKYILNYLNKPEQINGWLNIYKAFQRSNYIGLILGILIFYLVNHFYISI